MKSKVYTWVAIASILLIVVIISVVIVLVGLKNGGFNYVKIEYNPSIEFVTDTKDKVVSFRPLNDEARKVIANIDMVDRDVTDVVYDIMDNSLKMGYLKEENVIKLTSVSGLTQALDVHMYRAISGFLSKNLVYGVIVENVNDMEKIRLAKEKNVSVHELALIETIMDNSNRGFEELEKKMPDELIDIIMNDSLSYMREYPTTKEEVEEQIKIIEDNKDIYEKHMDSITKEGKREYMENQVKLSRQMTDKYEVQYSKMIKEKTH